MSTNINDTGEAQVPAARPTGESSSRKVIWISSLAILFAVVFCISFVILYTRNSRSLVAKRPVEAGKLLPSADLVDEFNKPLAESELKKGRMVLVFVTADCDACQKEADFLKGLVAKRPDVRFYGVISFGDMESSMKSAKEKFPFAVLYDRGFRLAGQLGIKRVPIKIFVDNGVMKKSWGGATIDEKAKADFASWLSEV